METYVVDGVVTGDGRIPLAAVVGAFLDWGCESNGGGGKGKECGELHVGLMLLN